MDGSPNRRNKAAFSNCSGVATRELCSNWTKEREFANAIDLMLLNPTQQLT